MIDLVKSYAPNYAESDAMIDELRDKLHGVTRPPSVPTLPPELSDRDMLAFVTTRDTGSEREAIVVLRRRVDRYNTGRTYSTHWAMWGASTWVFLHGHYDLSPNEAYRDLVKRAKLDRKDAL